MCTICIRTWLCCSLGHAPPDDDDNDMNLVCLLVTCQERLSFLSCPCTRIECVLSSDCSTVTRVNFLILCNEL